MKIGSPEHRVLFCRTFIDTHVPFEPEQLPWPTLDHTTLDRLRSLPFWSYARTIEQRAGRMVTSYAKTLDDPLIREAVALQGYEETRHGRLIEHMLERYGISAPHLDIPDPRAIRDDWLTFGFGECTDSFIGFGAFALVRQQRLFPAELMAIFDRVLEEEARHITFFVNWYRYEQALAKRGGFLRDLFASFRYQLRAILEAASSEAARTMENFDARSILALLEDPRPVTFLAAALAENRRMMAKLDARLPKPVAMPLLATLLLAGIRMLPPRPETASERARSAA
jgi:hypothetical protein